MYIRANYNEYTMCVLGHLWLPLIITLEFHIYKITYNYVAIIIVFHMGGSKGTTVL